MINRNNKKGFTIVELVIVIAVIAILAAVLIPTFAGIIKKANISADTQLCKNMNTALSMAKAEGESLDTMEDVLFAINEAGYVIENLNPTTEGYYFAWDQANDQILFLNDKFEVHYPENVELAKATCWITVGDAEEAGKVAAQGFALYLEPEFSGSLDLSKLVSVDAGVNTLSALSIADATTAGTIELRGTYTAATLNVPNADVEQHGAITNLTVTAVKDGTLKINGYVKTIAITAGKVVVNNTGVIETITEGAAKIDGAASTGLILDDTKEVAGYTAPTSVNISNKAELIAFRDAVNGGYTYAGKTVTLTADINLAGIAWTPIGNFYRKNTEGGNNITHGFMGTFDGNGHTIKNLSNKGFSIVDLKFGTNATTPANCSEAVYGLFGTVINAEIKNLTVTANIDMVAETSKLGDSVGAIVGFASGDTFKIENCKASGSIKGYDGVGGLVGRSYAKDNDANNCTNDATVYAIRKTAGIIGYLSCTTLDYSGCVGNGSVTTDKDADFAPDRDGYYMAGKLFVVGNGASCNGGEALTASQAIDN